MLGVGLPFPPTVVVLGDGEDGFGSQPFGVGAESVAAGARKFLIAPVSGQVAGGGGVIGLRDAPEFAADLALQHFFSDYPKTRPRCCPIKI